MKTKFNEKLNIRKKDNLFEIKISGMNYDGQEHDQTDWYYLYLNRRSAKLLCKKLQNLIKNGNV